MCGIFGFVGKHDALSTVLSGLSRLEYRGYDSAGTAFFDENDAINVIRTTGRVQRLTETAPKTDAGGAAIAHTRWATHGSVCERNAHPLSAGRVVLVHNGIIENFRELREELHYTPISETDTEIAAALIDSLYDGDPMEAIAKAQKRLHGSYAFAILFRDKPGVIYATRCESPLALMRTEQGSFLSSDPSAFPACGEYLVPQEHTIVEITADAIHARGEVKTAVLNKLDRSEGRQGYAHYMLKEIYEQPQALRRTVERYLVDGHVDFSQENIPDTLFDGIRHMHVVACGTAMHAGLVSSHLFRSLAGVEVTAHIASEFCDAGVLVDDDSLYVFISQSGETADTLAALRRVKAGGGRVLSVINRRGTIIERESGNVLHTSCGPEIAVASTKAFTAQVGVMYLLAIRMACARSRLDAQGESEAIASLLAGVDSVAPAIALHPQIAAMASRISKAKDVFFIGRAADYAIACEGALKLKEISYLHAESIAAGELKHGTISLIEPGVPSVAYLTRKQTCSRVLLSVQEILSRGGTVYLFATEDMEVPEGLDELVVCRLPAKEGAGAAFSAAVSLQLLAYETAKQLGMPIDMPRNLAKSVTVA